MFVCIYIINREDNAGYKLIWIFVILTFPVFGGFLYIAMGRKTTRKKLTNKMKLIDARTQTLLEVTNEIVASHEIKPHNKKVSTYITNLSHYPIYKNTGTEYYPTGELMYEAILKELEKATRYIFMEFFIIERGKMWDPILEILKRKADAGVDVRIIYDDIGCISRIPGNYYKTLNKMGIKTRVFNKLRASVNANNRTHRKIIVIDGNISFTGGINLADEYINEVKPFGEWKDTGIKLTGDATWSFTIMFLRFWQMLDVADPDISRFAPTDMTQTGYDTDAGEKEGYIQPLSAGPDKKNPLIKNTFLHMISNAREYVYINTPYLILDDETVLTLCLSASSGVDVRITMPGIPDKKYAYAMSHSFYAKLLESGVKIYEWEPGFMHAKSIIADGNTAYIGSCNFDYRSFYLHYECGVILYDDSVIDRMKYDYLETLSSCRVCTYEQFKNVNVFVRLGRSIMRIFAPLF